MKVYLIPKKNKKKDTYLSFLKEILIRDYKINNDISFHYNDDGKPYLNNSDIYFNVSHSGNAIAIGISCYDIGIDIEVIKERKLSDKIVEKVFLEDEKEEYEKTDNKIDYFYNIWTKKEAYVKLIGTGIKGYFNNVPNDYRNYVETRKIEIGNESYYLSIASFNQVEREKYEIIYE